MKIRPIHDRILVTRVEAQDVGRGGIIIPDTAKEKPQEGKVLAVGPGRIDDKGNRIPLDVAVGDVVIFSKYGGTEIRLGGDEVLILREVDVLGKLVRTVGKGKRKPAGATA